MMEPAVVEAVVLVGHGGAASDTPRALIARLKQLEGERQARRTPMTEEESALDKQVRGWPRTPKTDPYQAGVESLAERLRAALGPSTRVVVAYNEFCGPTIEEAVEGLVNGGARNITLVSTMLTPGGMHSEIEIPECVEALRARCGGVGMGYAWLFTLARPAAPLAEQVLAFQR